MGLMRLPSPSELRDRCRSAGLKATPQRLAVYEALIARIDHPSPEDIYRAVRKRLPTLSLATVYNTLDALASHGLASEVALLHESKRYDANLNPHHHLICTSCQAIVDIHNEKFDALELPKGLVDFVPEKVSVQILGLCTRCAKEVSKEETNG